MVAAAGGACAPADWTRIAADHVSTDKPRWAPDGRTLYSSRTTPGRSSTCGASGSTRSGAALSARRHDHALRLTGANDLPSSWRDRNRHLGAACTPYARDGHR